MFEQNDDSDPSLPLNSDESTSVLSFLSGPVTSHPRSALPAYLQIEEELAERIRTGELKPGTRIPPEREIASQTGVSRMTVRQALARLADRGLIRREQGRGTFVSEPKLNQGLSKLRGFFEEMESQGLVPTSRLLSSEEILASRVVAEVLGLQLGERVYKVVRVREGGGIPIVLETSFFPAKLVPGLLEKNLEGSIYRLMEQYGTRPIRAIQSHEPVLAGEFEGAILEVPVGSPLMLVERTAWDAHDRPVEFARDLYRGDRSRFVAELRL